MSGPASQPDPAAYLDLPVGKFLDALAAATPAPSGGAAAALTVSLAAGLCEMAARLSARHLPAGGRVAEQAAVLRARAAPLAQADAEAYQAVLAARRRPGTPSGPGTPAGPGDAAGQDPLAAALSAASAVPMAVAEIGAEVAGLAAVVAAGGNPALRGDAVTAALLAAAGARAAAVLVRINLAGVAADGRPAQAERLAEEAGRRAAQAENH